MSRTLSGRILTPGGFVQGALTFGSHIESVRGETVSFHESPEDNPLVLPGFIDTHVHGGGGGDTVDGPEGVRTLARFHLQRGVTTLYPTTITSPWEEVLAALRGVEEVMGEGGAGLPSIPGAHLEGPFISPKRLGAQPPFALEPTPARVEAVLELGVVRLVTLAPEIPGALEAAARFAAAGVRVSVGHTVASFEEVQALLKVVREAGGTVGFTHLYNAMGGLAGREPGVVGGALADRESFAELIFDTHHVHKGSFLAARAAKPGRLHLITDAIRAAGGPEGETELGGQAVTVEGGAARLPDGTLAGSVLTLDKALRNAVGAGVSVEEASRMLSQVPARYMGLNDRGVLEPGKRADLVVLDDALEVQRVFVAGREVGASDE